MKKLVLAVMPFLLVVGVGPAMAAGNSQKPAGNLQQRLNELEDIEAIKQLKYRYAEICDDFHNPDRVITLFTEDGIWEGGPFGIGIGHAQIHELFEGFRDFIDFSQHNMTNPIIKVNGNTATGEWYLFGPYRIRGSQQAQWLSGTYKDDYVKINGEWKYQHLRFNLRLWAPYTEGWSDELIVGF
jgi:hypothetical protein